MDLQYYCFWRDFGLVRSGNICKRYTKEKAKYVVSDCLDFWVGTNNNQDNARTSFWNMRVWGEQSDIFGMAILEWFRSSKVTATNPHLQRSIQKVSRIHYTTNNMSFFLERCAYLSNNSVRWNAFGQNNTGHGCDQYNDLEDAATLAAAAPKMMAGGRRSRHSVS